MNKDWLDLVVLEDYLDGKLDEKSMHQVERAALEDPFVAEALDGLSRSSKRSLASLSLLQKQLSERIADQQQIKKTTVISWQRLSIATTAAVVFISVGIIFWMKQVNYQQSAANKPKQVEVAIAPNTAKEQAVPPAARVSPPALSDEVVMNTKAKTKRANNITVPEAVTESTALSRKVSSDNLSTLSFSALSTPSSINGRVTDEENGNPIVGAYIYSVNEAGKYKLVGETDKEGTFVIPIDSLGNDREIVVSYISYHTKKLTVRPDEVLAVSLQESKNKLDEVVIRGYQKRTREAVTGSSYIITGKEVMDAPVSNVEELLQGKVAGLNIQNPAASPVGGWVKFISYMVKENKYSTDAKPGTSAEYQITIKNGRPVEATVLKGLSRKYDREAIRLIKNGPDWKVHDTPNPKATISLKY